MAANEDATAIADLAERYAQALWTSNVDMLAKMFHPAARLYGQAAGQLIEIERDVWLDMVESRMPGEGPTRCAVRDVSMPAPALASAAVDCETSGDRFTDILTFMKFRDGWRVIAKAFHAHGYPG